MVRIVYYAHESDTWEQFVERLYSIRQRFAMHTDDLGIVDEVEHAANLIEGYFGDQRSVILRRGNLLAEQKIQQLIKQIIQSTWARPPTLRSSLGWGMIVALKARYGLVVRVERNAMNLIRRWSDPKRKVDSQH